jgi:hypothetical protein
MEKSVYTYGEKVGKCEMLPRWPLTPTSRTGAEGGWCLDERALAKQQKDRERFAKLQWADEKKEKGLMVAVGRDDEPRRMDSEMPAQRASNRGKRNQR